MELHTYEAILTDRIRTQVQKLWKITILKQDIVYNQAVDQASENYRIKKII
jgi:hypothetical protein